MFESQVNQRAPLAKIHTLPTEKLCARTAEQMVLMALWMLMVHLQYKAPLFLRFTYRNHGKFNLTLH